MKQFCVSSDCTACGECLLQTNLLEEDPSGHAVPVADRYIRDEEITAAEEVAASCPAHALSIVEKATASLNPEAMIKTLKEKLESVDIPSSPNCKIAFNENDYSVDYGFISGEYSFSYSSESRALSAGKSKFRETFWNRRKDFALSYLAQYKSKLLRPFFDFTDPDKTYFAQFNKQFVAILKEAKAELSAISGDNMILPGSFTAFNPETDHDMQDSFAVRWLQEIDSVSYVNDFFEGFEKDKYHRLSYYEDCICSDDDVQVIGTDWLGNNKTKTTYSFYDANSTGKELVDDIASCLSCAGSYGVRYIDDIAEENVKSLIQIYKDLADKMIQQKISVYTAAVQSVEQANRKTDFQEVLNSSVEKELSNSIFPNGLNGNELLLKRLANTSHKIAGTIHCLPQITVGSMDADHSKAVQKFLHDMYHAIGRRTSANLKLELSPLVDGVVISGTVIGNKLTAPQVAYDEHTVVPIPGLDGIQVSHGIAAENPFTVQYMCFVTEENCKKAAEYLKVNRPYVTFRQAVVDVITHLTVSHDTYLSSLLSLYPINAEGLNDTYQERMEYIQNFGIIPDDMIERDVVEGNMEDLLGAIEFDMRDFVAQRSDLSFTIDGMVITAVDDKVQDIIAHDDHTNKFQVALRFDPATAIGEVDGIDLGCGPKGYRPIRISFAEPVFLDGVKYDHVPVPSVSLFEDLDLRYGSEINIHRVGDVIPSITVNRVGRKGVIQLPKYCPYCDEPLKIQGDRLFCNNPNCLGDTTSANLVNYLDLLPTEDEVAAAAPVCPVKSCSETERRKKILQLCMEGYYVLHSTQNYLIYSKYSSIDSDRKVFRLDLRTLIVAPVPHPEKLSYGPFPIVIGDRIIYEHPNHHIYAYDIEHLRLDELMTYTGWVSSMHASSDYVVVENDSAYDEGVRYLSLKNYSIGAFKRPDRIPYKYLTQKKIYHVNTDGFGASGKGRLEAYDLDKKLGTAFGIVPFNFEPFAEHETTIYGFIRGIGDERTLYTYDTADDKLTKVFQYGQDLRTECKFDISGTLRLFAGENSSGNYNVYCLNLDSGEICRLMSVKADITLIARFESTLYYTETRHDRETLYAIDLTSKERSLQEIGLVHEPDDED